jgi:hypothetical protein
MNRFRIIPTPIHGVLDYAVGILLVASPWIFRFSDVSSAKWTAIAVGLAMLGTAALTNYELGLMRLLPMHVHLLMDVVVGVFLAASPWIFGFSDRGTNAWVPLLVIGLAEIDAAAMSKPWPEQRRLRQREQRLFRHAARA